mgnify:CR=1 FL=1
MLPDTTPWKPRTEGYARVLAFPLALQGSMGEELWAIDEPAVVRRGEDPGPCYVALDRGGLFWHVRTPDGREMAVPVASTVVYWSGLEDLPARRPAPEQGVQEVPPEAQAPERPVYKCTYCSAPYLTLADALVCARLDDPNVPPFPKGFDCRLCGYPLELHSGEPHVEAGLCVLALPGGVMEEARHHARHAEKPKQRRLPHCASCGHAAGAHKGEVGRAGAGCEGKKDDGAGHAIPCDCVGYREPTAAELVEGLLKKP